MRFGQILAACLLLAPIACATADKKASQPTAATFITREEIERVNAAPSSDRNIKVVDIGHENFAVGVIHRGRTQNGRMLDRPQGPPYVLGEPCGPQAAGPPATGAYPAGIIHDAQTEGYYILSGGGTIFTGGHLLNGKRFVADNLNGPTCIGPSYDVSVRTVREGDIVIIPAGVIHGWVDVPDHVDYLSFRPSPGILTGGWEHPALKE